MTPRCHRGLRQARTANYDSCGALVADSAMLAVARVDGSTGAGCLKRIPTVTDFPDIPVIMRRRGWPQGATLLQHWMDHPSNTNPSLGIPDLSTVKVSWTLAFPRAKAVYDFAVRGKVWTAPDAKIRIRAMLSRHYGNNQSSLFHVDNPRRVDPESFTATNIGNIYEDRVAYVPMGEWTTLDALTAALGRFGYYFNVSGSCEPQGSRFAVQIDRVGIYIRDSFDFEGFQPLGFWDTHDDYVSRSDPSHCWEVGRRTVRVPFMSPTTVPVYGCGMATYFSNGRFRDYRTHTGKGSDFYVYSDIVYINTHDRFMV